MHTRNQQGSLSHRTPTAPSGARLYQMGPLRLQDHSLKTVKAYISRTNLCHNATRLKARCGTSVRLCAVVKANAYGHDARSVVSTLAGCYADCFAVSTIEEAELIFPFVQAKPIIVVCPVFAGIDPQLIRLAQARRFHCTVCSFDTLDYLESILDDSPDPLRLQLKIDTGMGRLGCSVAQTGLIARTIRQSSLFEFTGVYTHFATADDPNLDFACRQLATFETVLSQTGLDSDPTLLRHAANTSAALRLDRAHFDMIRCGIGLYGYTNGPTHSDETNGQAPAGEPIDLRPVLRVEAPLVQVKTLTAGRSCGYGGTFTAPHDMTIGIVPVGYADGLLRQLSNRATMRIGSHQCPIIGRISMDLTIIDLTGLPAPAEGNLVTVVDDCTDSPCNACALAELAGTVPYEILTAIGNRIKRVLTD